MNNRQIIIEPNMEVFSKLGVKSIEIKNILLNTRIKRITFNCSVSSMNCIDDIDIIYKDILSKFGRELDIEFITDNKNLSLKDDEIKGYRLVVPVDAQKKLTERIIGYWQDGTGGQYNKDREEAFRVTDVTESIEEVIKEIEKIEGQKPLIITTSARTFDNSISYKDLSKQIFEDDKPYLLLFGTGWGLTDEVMAMSDYILEPIRANSKYNHLSVRAAVAIILDRLFGEN